MLPPPTYNGFMRFIADFLSGPRSWEIGCFQRLCHTGLCRPCRTAELRDAAQQPQQTPTMNNPTKPSPDAAQSRVTSSALFGLSWNECRDRHGHRIWEAESPFHTDGSPFMFRVLALRSGKLWRFFDDSDPEAKLLKDKGNHWRTLAYAKAAFQEYASKVVKAHSRKTNNSRTVTNE